MYEHVWDFNTKYEKLRIYLQKIFVNSITLKL